MAVRYEYMTSDDFKDAYKLKREKIYSKIAKIGSIEAEKIMQKEYIKLCEEAAGGDCVAQDLLAEWFRNGNQVVKENIDLSMKWLFLAGANGNKFSLDRLKIHFNSVFYQIYDLADFDYIIAKKHLTEENAPYVIGKIVCEELVEYLKIDALELARADIRSLPYSAIIMRGFDRAVDKCFERIKEKLRK